MLENNSDDPGEVNMLSASMMSRRSRLVCFLEAAGNGNSVNLGQCPAEIWDKCNAIPVVLFLKRFLKSGITHIVTCGHGSGGAVANLTAIRFILEIDKFKGMESQGANSSHTQRLV